MKKFKLLYSLLLLLGFMACSDDEDPVIMPEEMCETADLTYDNEIAAIINGSCAFSGCHGAGTMTTFPMSNYTETAAAVGFGKIISAINHETNFSPMPKNGAKLEDCTIDKITAWINDGAPES